MIRYQKDMTSKVYHNMREGDGDTIITSLFEEHVPHVRILAVITLEPGCSIGPHLHENESEAFYILEGEPAVLSDGEYVTLHPGDAHLCRNGEQHSLVNRSDKPIRVLAIIPTMAE